MEIIDFKEQQIREFFRKDILDFSAFPDTEIANYFKNRKTKNKILDFTGFQSEKLKQELKDYLYLIMNGKNNKNYKSKVMNEFFHYFNYIQEKNYNSLFCQDIEDAKREYCLYRSLSKNYTPQQLIYSLYSSLTDYYDTREGTDRDIWELKQFNLPENRLNLSKKIYNINFTLIKNKENRELIKKYIKYLIELTELKITTINSSCNDLSIVSNSISKSFLEMTANDFELYEITLKENTNEKNTKYKYFNNVREFYNFLIINGLYTKENPIPKNPFKTKQYNYKQTAVSDYVVFQIFNKLHLLPFDLMLFFIINYATGMRISDICQLKTDCLYIAKEHYFIRHYVQKMSKYQINIIPKSVYDLIQKQIKIVKSKDSSYLFPSSSNKDLPQGTQHFSKILRKHIDSWNIKNEDGTQYHYRSHAFRHTIATKLLNDYNVDLSVIQLGVLGHVEINMSLCYAERNDIRKEKYQKNFIGVDGKINSLSNTLDEKFLKVVNWMNQTIEMQVLPDGFCSYPMRLGTCPNFEACLTCEFFKTSVEYLELHKQHLAAIENNIPFYEANGWINNLETAKTQRDSLKKIIAGLEKLKKGEIDGST